EATGFIAVGFQHDVHVALRAGTSAHSGRKLRNHVRAGVVDDAVDRIQPQPVEAVLLDPVKRVVDEKIPHWSTVLAVEVYRCAPRRLMIRIEELRRVLTYVIPFRAE